MAKSPYKDFYYYKLTVRNGGISADKYNELIQQLHWKGVEVSLSPYNYGSFYVELGDKGHGVQFNAFHKLANQYYIIETATYWDVHPEEKERLLREARQRAEEEQIRLDAIKIAKEKEETLWDNPKRWGNPHFHWFWNFFRSCGYGERYKFTPVKYRTKLTMFQDWWVTQGQFHFANFLTVAGFCLAFLLNESDFFQLFGVLLIVLIILLYVRVIVFWFYVIIDLWSFYKHEIEIDQEIDGWLFGSKYKRPRCS